MATETKEKPKSKEKTEVEVDKTSEKIKQAEEQQEQLDKEIEVFEPVALAVDRTLEFGGQTKTYTQHEMGFMTKLKFFQLLSGTIRLASEDTEGGTSAFLDEIFGSLDQSGPSSANAMFGGLMRLVELSPEFIENAYMFALSVPVNERDWAKAALENLTDEEGIDILETFVAQNAESIHDFFTKHLARIGKRVATMFGPQDQSETTA